MIGLYLRRLIARIDLTLLLAAVALAVSLTALYFQVRDSFSSQAKSESAEKEAITVRSQINALVENTKKSKIPSVSLDLDESRDVGDGEGLSYGENAISRLEEFDDKIVRVHGMLNNERNNFKYDTESEAIIGTEDNPIKIGCDNPAIRHCFGGSIVIDADCTDWTNYGCPDADMMGVVIIDARYFVTIKEGIRNTYLIKLRPVLPEVLGLAVDTE